MTLHSVDETTCDFNAQGFCLDPCEFCFDTQCFFIDMQFDTQGHTSNNQNASGNQSGHKRRVLDQLKDDMSNSTQWISKQKNQQGRHVLLRVKFRRNPLSAHRNMFAFQDCRENLGLGFHGNDQFQLHHSVFPSCQNVKKVRSHSRRQLMVVSWFWLPSPQKFLCRRS